MAAYRRRRSAAQWQELINEQRTSALSAKQFCTTNNLGYQSFQHWKSKLASEASIGTPAGIDVPAFVELTGAVVHGTAHKAEHAQPPTEWLAELDLGSGVCLRIARPA